MKKTKQQEIDELRQELSECSKEKNRYDNILSDLKNLLFEKDAYNHKFSDIYPEVVILFRFQHSNDIRDDVVTRQLREQNDKFWLLIRSLSGDNTLEKEMDLEFKRRDESRVDMCGGDFMGGRNFRR